MKSIFDGWTKQRFWYLTGDNGTSFCARGWIHRNENLYGEGASLRLKTTDDEVRIAGWIRANLNPPASYVQQGGKTVDLVNCDPARLLAWANNTKALDIEGFKMVDLLTQGYVPEETAVEEVVHEQS